MCSGDAALQAQQQHATAQTRGIAPLVQSAVLTDRRHILTKDAEGNVELWDTATAAVKERFGQVQFCLQSCLSFLCVLAFDIYTKLLMLSKYKGQSERANRDIEPIKRHAYTDVSPQVSLLSCPTQLNVQQLHV